MRYSQRHFEGERSMGHDIAANKELARQFIENINRHDYTAMDALLHPSFVWNTAVVPDNAPNEMRKMQSKMLQGKNLHHAKPRMNREESMKAFHDIFIGNYNSAMRADAKSDAPPDRSDDKHRIHLKIHGMTAEEDRVAMEAESYLVEPNTGRIYNNLYHYLFRIRDRQISLFKEYQDTLHLFDFRAE
jgi:ketosteroid isomerase-like protein